MNIVPIKHRNADENNRVEFLWKDFDFIDGNRYIAEVLAQDYGMRVTEEIDGIWYIITRMRDGTCEYNLVWHEDVDNFIYSTEQDERTLQELETRVHAVAEKLNSRFRGIPGTDEKFAYYLQDYRQEDKPAPDVEKLFTGNGIELVRKHGELYLLYDAGEICDRMEEIRITEEEAELAKKVRWMLTG